MRGFALGTTTVRAAVEYDAEANEAAFGGHAVEYLKGASPWLRPFGGVEGDQHELEQITEVQRFLRPDLFLKLNDASG